MCRCFMCFFFFQAEDGIRDDLVTGVQTCALPICCRSPLGFLMTNWRDGTLGGLRMGLRHGVYCLGCCWLLMCLLFVAGVMNLMWVAGLTAFVLVEKIGPFGLIVARVAGAIMIVAGILIAAGVR